MSRTARTARIYRATQRNIEFLAARLRAGELVAVPTETVYGLAADAFDCAACASVFRAKGRPSEDPLIVHVHAMTQLSEVCHVNDTALRLAKAFWPGPLTLVLPKKPIIPDIVTAGRDSVAIRMPSHPVFRRLLRAVDVPLAAPSANPFGYVSPTSAQHVLDGLGAKLRYILDGGPSQIGLESTIVDLRDPARPVVLRPGFITVTQIARVLRCRLLPKAQRFRGAEARSQSREGAEVLRCGDQAQNVSDSIRAAKRASFLAAPPRLRSSVPLIRAGARITLGKGAKATASKGGALAPGQLARHYSPRTPVRLRARLKLPRRPNPQHAYLLMRKPSGPLHPNVFWLDPHGDLQGVARQLFAMLRKLDAMGFDVIHAELARGSGLADAINDRLRRAAAR